MDYHILQNLKQLNINNTDDNNNNNIHLQLIVLVLHIAFELNLKKWNCMTRQAKVTHHVLKATHYYEKS